MTPDLLVVSEFFPHAKHPHEGVHVQEQLLYTPGGQNATVFAPTIWYPPVPRYRPWRANRAAAGWQQQEGRRVFRVAIPHLPLIAEWLAPGTFLRKVRAEIIDWRIPFDLIHAHWAYRSGYVAWRLAQEFCKPLVITVYGSDVNRWLFERRKRRKLLAALAGATAVVALSENLRQKLIGENLAAAMIFTVPSGIDLALFAPPSAVFVPEMPRHFADTFVFACVANLYPVKGIALLLRALATTPSHIGLLLIGDGPERPHLEQLVHSLQLGHRVWLAGRQAHASIPAWLHAVDALVLASHNEGLPSVVLEALACGKPVVATAVGGIPEIINSDRLGILVPPADIGALAEALVATAAQSWDVAAIRRRAEDFSWVKFQQRITEIYQRVLTASAGG